MKKASQNIPNSAIQICPFLQNISLKLTTDFAYKLFVTPTKHKLPEREEKMESEAACKYIKISKIRKKIRVLEYGKSEKKNIVGSRLERKKYTAFEYCRSSVERGLYDH